MGKKRKLDKERHLTDSRLHGNDVTAAQAGAVKVKVTPT